MLTIVGAFWSQVEYRVKQVKPWQILKQGPANADESVLLDYVSPWNILAIFKSLKAGHHIVTITILNTLLLRLLIVFSTGLLLLQDVVVQNIPAQLVATDQFDHNEFNASSVDATPTLTVSGISLLDLNFPPGTSSDYAYQSFNLSNTMDSANTTMIGSVNTFTADLQCEPATLQHYHQSCIYNLGCQLHGLFIQLTASSCTTDAFLAFERTNYAIDGFFGGLAIASCVAHSLGQDGNRLAIVTGHFDANQSLSFTGFLCKPTYGMSKREVSIDGSGSLKIIDSSSNSISYSLPLITPWDILDGANSSLLAASRQIATWDDPYDPDIPYVDFDTFFLLLNITAPQAKATDYLDQAWLLDASRRTFRSLAVQLAKQYLMISKTDEFAGTMQSTESRLLVHDLSLRAMEAILIVLVLSTGFVILFRPQMVSICDPGSIAGASMMFTNSSSFVKRLSIVGLVSEERLRASTFKRQYLITVAKGSRGSTPKVDAVSDCSMSHTGSMIDVSRSKHQWWRPFAATLSARVFILLTPILLMVALETVYQISRRYDGIANVDLQSYIHYSWVYVPALVMLAARAIFDTVDFNTRLLQPYCTLSQQPSTAERSVLVNYLAKISLRALCSALAKRHFAVALTSATMFMAPFLTIVVSGLFATSEVARTSSVVLEQLDWFDISILYATNSDGDLAQRDGLVSSLVATTDLTYPQWTFDDLVLPQISLPARSSEFRTSSILQATMPALRTSLNCTSVSTDNINEVRWISTNSFWFSAFVGTECGSFVNNKTDAFDYQVNVIPDMNNGSYFGVLQMTTGGAGCPTAMAFYGQVDGISVAHINIQSCFVQTDRVDVDITFTMPAYGILSANVDTTTAIAVTDPNPITQSDISAWLPRPVNTEDYVYDSIFSLLIHGGSKFPPTAITDLLDSANASRLSDALSNLYGVVIAQIVNLSSRTSTLPLPSSSSSTTSPTIDGVLINSNITRLQQSQISTRILDGLLIAMTMCVAISFFLIKTDKIVPLNPCSIAAMASLLAGSRMLDQDGAAKLPVSGLGNFKMTKDVEKIFEGRTFSLKWWRTAGDGHEPRARYRIDADDENDNETGHQPLLTTGPEAIPAERDLDTLQPSENR